jgi:hypothetical protein
MSEAKMVSINWGSVVISLAIIGITAFALYITRDLWCLLVLFFLCYSCNFQLRTEKSAPKKCRCNGKKCSGAGTKPDNDDDPDDGRNCGC